MKKLFDKFENLWKMFIRPPRAEYNLYDLGPSFICTTNNITVQRNDIELQNYKQQIIYCSLFEICDLSQMKINQNQKVRPWIIYLHCNTGSRLEVLPILDSVFRQGINVFCFDFSGCGKSQGEYISLGLNEIKDLEIVIQYLKSTKQANQISLWGRSMGAVTAILYATQNSNVIKSIICDSAFAHLEKMILELALSKTKIPKFILRGILHLINNQIQKIAGFSLKDLDLREKVKNCHIPIIFAASKEDSLIRYWHSQLLFNNYGSNKHLVFFEGNHCDERSQKFITQMVSFVKQHFIFNEDKSYKKINDIIIKEYEGVEKVLQKIKFEEENHKNYFQFEQQKQVTIKQPTITQVKSNKDYITLKNINEHSPVKQEKIDLQLPIFSPQHQKKQIFPHKQNYSKLYSNSFLDIKDQTLIKKQNIYKQMEMVKGDIDHLIIEEKVQSEAKISPLKNQKIKISNKLFLLIYQKQMIVDIKGKAISDNSKNNCWVIKKFLQFNYI